MVWFDDMIDNIVKSPRTKQNKIESEIVMIKTMIILKEKIEKFISKAKRNRADIH